MNNSNEQNKGSTCEKILDELEQLIKDSPFSNQEVNDWKIRHHVTDQEMWQYLLIIISSWIESDSREDCRSESPLYRKAFQRRELLFSKALAEEDYALALRIEQDRCKIAGAYNKKQRPENAEEHLSVNGIEQSAKPDQERDLSDAELEQLVRRKSTTRTGTKKTGQGKPSSLQQIRNADLSDKLAPSSNLPISRSITRRKNP